MSGNEQKKSKRADDHASPDKRTEIIEWIIGGLSACLVAGVIAALVHDALYSWGGYPELLVVVEGSFPAGDGYLVQFNAQNHGNATAAGVEIEGQISDGGRVLETSSVTLDYVPGNSEHKGGLLFKADPEAYELVVSAKGYQEP